MGHPITNIFLISTPSSTNIVTLNEISPTLTPTTKIALTTIVNPITYIAPTNIISTPTQTFTNNFCPTNNASNPTPSYTTNFGFTNNAPTATNYIVTNITPTTTDIKNNIVLQDQEFFSTITNTNIAHTPASNISLTDIVPTPSPCSNIILTPIPTPNTIIASPPTPPHTIELLL